MARGWINLAYIPPNLDSPAYKASILATIVSLGKINLLTSYPYLATSFGFAVMGRISLLIGRFEELIEYSSFKYYYSTPAILVLMIIVLTYWSAKNTNINENN